MKYNKTFNILALAAVSYPALLSAQSSDSPKSRSPLDENGVNLATGIFSPSVEELDIGSAGQGGLEHRRFLPEGDGGTNSFLSQNLTLVELN